MATTAALASPLSHDNRLSLVTAGIVWVLVILMIVPEGFDYSLVINSKLPVAGDIASRVLWTGLLAAATLIVLWRASFAALVLRQLNIFLLAFIALAVASVVWSVDPMLTVRRDVRLITVVLVGLAFVLTGWHERRFQNVVRPILTLVIVGSIVFGLVAPSLAIHQETSPELIGAWRGLTNHKNSLGAIAGVTAVLWVHAWSSREVRWWRALFGAAAAGVCIWLSRSATALVATLFALAMLGLLTKWPRGLQPYLKYAVALVAIGLVAYTLAMLGLVPGRTLLLKPVSMITQIDTTFTGRSGIWWILGEHVRQHPVLGTGYGAYWAGPIPQSPSYAFITRMNGFYPGSAHNGYLEIANDLGWVGLLCLFGYMTVYVRQALRGFATDKSQAALYLTLFLQHTLANYSESHWLSVLSVQFVLMTLTTTALARLLLDRKLRLRFAARAAAAISAWQLSGGVR